MSANCHYIKSIIVKPKQTENVTSNKKADGSKSEESVW